MELLPTITPTVIICATYLVLLFIARFFWLTLPNNNYLSVYSEHILAKFWLEQKTPEQLTPRESVVLEELSRLIQKQQQQVPDHFKFNWILGASGRQLAAWRTIHEAETLVTDILTEENIRAKARVMAERLSTIKGPEASALSKYLKENLDTTNISLLTANLKESQRIYFSDRDNYFEALANKHNRTMWMVFITISILILVGATEGNTNLFVLGAIGGILSRLRKAITQKTAAFDYGESWSRLFLTPLVGALTGWAGILIATTLAKLDLLGNVFGVLKTVEWGCAEPGMATMALAIVFGYSASLFDTMLEQVENSKPNAQNSDKDASQ